MGNVVDRIDALMAERKVTQRELARALDINEGTISRWRHHKSVPAVEFLAKVAAFFHVSLDYLATGKDFGVGFYTDEDKKLVRLFHQLDERGKESVISFTQFQIEYDKDDGDEPC